MFNVLIHKYVSCQALVACLTALLNPSLVVISSYNKSSYAFIPKQEDFELYFLRTRHHHCHKIQDCYRMKSPSTKQPSKQPSATAVDNNKAKYSPGLCNDSLQKQTQAAFVMKAAKDLLQQRAESGGKSTYGDLKRILQQYQDLGHTFVTRWRLSAQITKLYATKEFAKTPTVPAFIDCVWNEESSVQSELTDSFGPSYKFKESFAAEAVPSNQQTAVCVAQNRAGHPIATISTEQSNQQTVAYSAERRRSPYPL
jgi:hypothetical protein